MGPGAGCGGPALSTPAELAAFETAGPIQLPVDLEKLVRARIPPGPYRVVRGDQLTLAMPTIMQAVSTTAEGDPNRASREPSPFACRVDASGAIALPAVGDLAAAGKTLGEIESAVVAAYYPKYVTKRPSVMADVSRHHTVQASIIGAVKKPGVYQLRSDELSLIAILMKAGGIAADGAQVIRILRPGTSGPATTLALPVRGLNLPFADVALTGGETIQVERFKPRLFTVMGLVTKAGAFEYPVDQTYHLVQALAFAGGINETADPRYVKIYRQDAGGGIVAATLRIGDEHWAKAARIPIRPGDVVSVEHTDRTRTRTVLADLFRASFGGSIQATYPIK
jgi:polysaccharide export outer membrane protein